MWQKAVLPQSFWTTLGIWKKTLPLPILSRQGKEECIAVAEKLINTLLTLISTDINQVQSSIRSFFRKSFLSALQGLRNWSLLLYYPNIGVHRVGLVGALHPSLVSHPPFIFAPRCRIGCKKIVFLHLFIPMTLPHSYLIIVLTYHHYIFFLSSFFFTLAMNTA